MAYGPTLEGGYGATASVIHTDSSHAFVVSIADADLLFRGDFRREGPDLILTGQDGRHHIIPGYFASEHRAALVAPNGASLSPEVVDLLAGSPAPGQYAQAQPTTAPEVAGKVEKVVGNANVIRNGASVALNVGDAVYKSDVIQTSDHASVGISFPDGTALNLVANTRMALNEYSYDSNSTSNSALFSLVEGTFSFVAGRVAHTGDMKIATPVATMGIRGTTGSAHQLTSNEIASVSATLGSVTYMFTIDNDLGVNTHGIYDLILNGVVVGSIAQPGLAWYLDQNGNLISQPMTDAQQALDQALREAVYDIERSNVIPHSTPGSNGSSGLPPTEQLPNPSTPPLPDNSEKPFIIDLPINGPTGPVIVPFTVTFVQPPPSVKVTPLPVDHLKPGLHGTTSHVLAEHVQINDQSTSYVPGSAVVAGPSGVPPGLVTVDAQGNVDYSDLSFAFLSQGESIQYAITFDVEQNGHVVQETLSLTIIGVNEPPTFTASNTSVEIAEPPHPAGSAQPLATVAALTFTDPNLDDTSYTTSVIGVTGTGHTQGLAEPSVALTFLQADGVSKDAGSANGTADFAFAAPEGSFDYLSKGETVTLVYTVQVTDPYGATSTQTVSVTVVGTNEAPAIQPLLVADPGPIHAPAGTPDPDNSGQFLPLVESNSFSFTDPNYDDTHTITVAYDAAQSNTSQEIGSLTATLHNDSTGGNQGLVNWAFSVDPALVNALAPGTVLREVFDITVADNFGGSAVKEVVITIDGPVGTGFVWLPDSPAPPTSSGNWNIAADWSGGAVPGAQDSAAINNPVQVTINDSESVDNLTIATGAIVDIVEPGSLTVYGTVNGGGTIQLDSPSNNDNDPTLFVDGTVTLQGGGTIAMLGPAADNNIIGVAGSNAELLNLDYVIKGSGTIGQGDGNLTLVNDGTVDATGTLVIETGSNAVINAGLLEATSGGTLEIESDVGNAGGTIAAYDYGSVVQLSNVTVTGGTFVTNDPTSNDGGVIEILAPGGTNTSVLDGSTSAVTIDGYVNVDAGAALELIGTIHNEGTINLDPLESVSSDLVIDGRVTLDGGGLVTLSGSDAIVGAPGDENNNVLKNFDTISGSGQIVSSADAPLKLHNESGGIVDATGLLTIDTGGYRILNAGHMEATQGGELDIESKLRNIGLVLALCNSEVLIDANVHNKSDGAILARGYDALVDFSDDRVRNDGVIAAKYHGTVTFDDARMANDKGGTVEAAGNGSSVVISYSGVENDGVIKAAFGGMVSIDCSTVDNASGIIAAYGYDSTVQLSGATVNHGELDSAYGGKIEILSGAASTFDDLTNRANVIINPDATLILRGTIENDGLIVVDSVAPAPVPSGADLVIDGRVALEGSGKVELDGDADKITGASQGGTLDNFSTIDGYGQIGTGGEALTLHNERYGKIDADVANRDLIIDTGSKIITNAGVLEATHGGTLVIDSDVDNAWGIIAAYGYGSTVQLSGAAVSYGELGSAYGGKIEILSGAASTFDDLTNRADVIINPDATLILRGTIDNDGLIVVDSEAPPHVPSGADLVIDGRVTLEGWGVVELDGDADKITGASYGGTLDNFSTIDGYGQIGTGSRALTLDNEHDGKVDATGTLVIDTGCNAIINAGLLEATNGGTLEIKSDVDNKGGTIGAYGADALIKLVGVTITGGTLATGDPYWRDDGVIEVVATAFAGITTFDGSQSHSPVTIAGFVQVDPGALLELKGDIDLAGGAIELDQTVVHHETIGSGLLIDGKVTLDGYGDIALEGDHAGIVGVAGSDATLDNDSSIYGSRGGFIGTGNNALTLVNEQHGVIDSEAGDAGPLVIDTGHNVISNAGLLEASGAGSTLEILSDVDNNGGRILAVDGAVYLDNSVIGNAYGLIAAFGHDGTVDLDHATIIGGTLETGWGGLIQTVWGNSTFDDVTITCGSDVLVNDDTVLTLLGQINNFGTITVGCGDPDVVIDGRVTLDDGGLIVLSGYGDNIVGAAGFGNWNVLTNDDDIVGAGNIGGGNGFWGGYSDLSLINQGIIDADAAHQTLTINTGFNIIFNTGTLEASHDGTLVIDSQIDNSHGLIDADSGSRVDIAADVYGGNANIDGGTLEYEANSTTNTRFDGDGTLVLDGNSHTSHFTGTVSDFSSGDSIDLADIAYSKSGINETQLAYNSHNDTLTVSDGSHGPSMTIQLQGDYNASNFVLGQDSNGDAEIAYNSTPTITGVETTHDSSTTAHQELSGAVTGTISFDDADAGDTHTASATPLGSHYVGAFAVSGLNEDEGVGSANWSFNFNGVGVPAGHTLTQSYDVAIADNHGATATQAVSISIGGPGNDNFVFTPGVGADTVVNFNPQQDTIDLSHFTNVQSTQQLASLISNDAHGDAVIDLGNHDSITLPGLSAAQLQAVLQSVVHLH